MGAVKNILGTVGGFLGPIFAAIGRFFSAMGALMEKFSVVIFLLGFIGLLFAFIWFFLRYLDKRRLALPALIFTIFFVIFLSGNVLLISQDAKTKAAAKAERDEQTEQTEQAEQDAPPLPGGEAVIGAPLSGKIPCVVRDSVFL